MPAKFPVANFKSQAEYHQYLESLTHPQLKKVATALNKILRKEYLLSTKKPKDELLADIKRLYSFNSESKLLTLINGIDTQDLPGPSMNIRKPTKKQAAEGAKVQAEYEKQPIQFKKEYLESLIGDYDEYYKYYREKVTPKNLEERVNMYLEGLPLINKLEQEHDKLPLSYKKTRSKLMDKIDDLEKKYKVTRRDINRPTYEYVQELKKDGFIIFNKVDFSDKAIDRYLYIHK